MTGALAVTFSGTSMYISSAAGLLPKSVTWTRAPWTVAERQSPKKIQYFKTGTMIADIALDIDCGGKQTLILVADITCEAACPGLYRNPVVYMCHWRKSELSIQDQSPTSLKSGGMDFMNNASACL